MEHRTKLATAVAALALQGCAALLPNTISPVVEHTSHLLQHEPFTSHPTHYGFNQVALVAHWGVATGPFLEISEGINLNKCNSGGQAYGGLYGGREIFTARAGFEFRVK